MNNITIAVDGPAGAGKSTIAKIIAKKLKINYIDTGAMYRAFTYLIVSKNIDFNNKIEIQRELKNVKIEFLNNHIYLNDKIVDSEIRTDIVNKNVSNIAKLDYVREHLVNLQKIIAQKGNTIMDGRDIGTNVIPDAKYKFFITASLAERGKRRHKQLIKTANDISLSQTIKSIEKRDIIDATRQVSPLIKAHDAIEIDTTNKTIDDTVEIILNYIREGGN
ncbi:(d)CMP kinase [Abyssisolibacter fermentans]|uniref:(d)CMP kinase n=1 Tax=Abyssisolibacter fermentans TaxID=1766203 RepID=UPI0008350C23|nr:(d)CMP kinase [Abyssisolibacter fermentans]